MTVIIDGVSVENPTAVWMQLKNTRMVLGKRQSWNNNGWFLPPDGLGRASTMCLANAIRYVVKGTKATPTDHARESLLDAEIAELVVLAQIQKLTGDADIPSYNDATGRRHAEILQTLDMAIEAVAPHARTHAMVFADEVMTAAERKEIDDAVWRVEGEMWEEDRQRFAIHQDGKGNWRDGGGRFAQVPAWVRNPERSRTMIEFRNWLTDHQERGWGTFWDELKECDPEKDPHCSETENAVVV
jgi:hypothetical protein